VKFQLFDSLILLILLNIKLQKHFFPLPGIEDLRSSISDCLPMPYLGKFFAIITTAIPTPAGELTGA